MTTSIESKACNYLPYVALVLAQVVVRGQALLGNPGEVLAEPKQVPAGV